MFPQQWGGEGGTTSGLTLASHIHFVSEHEDGGGTPEILRFSLQEEAV